MPIEFHKMHGAGNDFVLLDFRQSDQQLDAPMATRLSDRRLGVGCDQILILDSSDKENCAARYRIFNSDGSSAGQCGNGVRCIALYLLQSGEFGQAGRSDDDPVGSPLRLEGPSGIVQVTGCEDGEFECAMGEPRFGPNDIPVDMSCTTAEQSGDRLVLDVEQSRVEVTAVSMGNPHAVMLVEDSESVPVEDLGPKISAHPAFPNRCNAGFAEIIDSENIRLRVFERGAGETLACGSGACAAVAALNRQNLVSGKVNVFLRGGHLVIKWSGPGSQVMMKGPAQHVFRGTLDE